jgi:murein DD-endopeptidase MepM/ murein hydrolase activator NlpD
MVTQGYDVGTHAPAAVWGALDLAVDGDGDGFPEATSTYGALVFTPHAGAVRVALSSWPGGNYVRVTNAQSGWATAYAHLDQVFVADGQWLEAGAPIGTIGTTGMTTGAHLHYEVWRNGANIDPTPYVQCW